MPEVQESAQRRFIALVEVERDELDEDTGGWVTFDSFAANSPDHWYADSQELLTLRAPFRKAAHRFPSLADLNSTWVQMVVQTVPTADSVPAQVVMFGGNLDNRPVVGIASIEPIPRELSAALTSEARLVSELRVNPGFISGILEIPLRGIDPDHLAVAVYDVGQGSCSAIVDNHEHPRVYFDLGWAPNFHAPSRPPCVPSHFSCEHHATAPVVLSHWDMDHWCYAIADSYYNPGSLTTRHEWKTEALERFWIARPPEDSKAQLGPLALSFYRALQRTELLPGLGAILLWPEKTKRIDFSGGWLEACRPPSGTPIDRNNSGIAMYVRPSAKVGAVLLTGDADFPCIPSVAGKRKVPLAGLVAPHHGAKVTAAFVPKPKKGSPSRLVMSVGAGNSYGHPKQQAIDAYQENGWRSTMTQSRYNCWRVQDVPHQHGNTLLKFSSAVQDPQCGCSCVEAGNLCLAPSSTSLPSPKPGVKAKIKKAKKAAAVA
jgi:hypothetical protein